MTTELEFLIRDLSISCGVSQEAVLEMAKGCAMTLEQWFGSSEEAAKNADINTVLAAVGHRRQIHKQMCIKAHMQPRAFALEVLASLKS